LGAIGVIWVHACHNLPTINGRTFLSLGRFAVPFFTASAVYFALLALWRKPELRFSAYFRRRVVRLYLPFLAWTAVYLAMQFARQRFLHATGEFALRPYVLWNGGDYHLWFLPFILVATLAMYPVARLLNRAPMGVAVATSLALAATSSFLRWPAAWDRESLSTLRQGLEQLPAIFVGIAFAFGRPGGGGAASQPPRPLFAVAGVALLLSSMVSEYLLGRSLLLECAAAFGCMTACASHLRPTGLRWIGRLGKWSFGIYLIHLLFVGALRTLAMRHGLESTLMFVAVATAVSFVAAAWVTSLLWKVPRMRWLVA
jgi:peptidoglycan/LPS O-acetylase OafA/YrhL